MPPCSSCTPQDQIVSQKVKSLPNIGKAVHANVRLNQNECLLDRERASVLVEVEAGADRLFPSFKGPCSLKERGSSRLSCKIESVRKPATSQCSII